MATKTYFVQTPLLHDGKAYEIGDSIKLDVPAGHPLIVTGTVALPASADKATADTEGEGA